MSAIQALIKHGAQHKVINAAQQVAMTPKNIEKLEYDGVRSGTTRARGVNVERCDFHYCEQSEDDELNALLQYLGRGRFVSKHCWRDLLSSFG